MTDFSSSSPIKVAEEPMADVAATITASTSVGGQCEPQVGNQTTIEIERRTSNLADPDHAKLGGNDVANGASTTEGADPANTTQAIGSIEVGVDTEKKSKKKRKPAKKKIGKNVTGFEEFYADAPITPEEARKEKKELMMFNKYLWLGGIDSSQRQFTGFAEDREALAKADAVEIRQMTATDFVGGSGSRFYDLRGSENWFVDFTGIVKGFLSRTIPSIYLYDEAANQLAAGTIKNFLNYVLMHDVCPEYEDDIQAARAICDIAPLELRMTHDLLNELPGNFNAIANSLFTDRLVDKLDITENFDKLLMFRFAVLLSPLSGDVKKKFLSFKDPSTNKVVNTKEETYQVIEKIKLSRAKVKENQQELEKAGHSGKWNPTGVIKVKPSIIEFGYDNLPRADEVDLSNALPEDYLVEEELLVKFEKGMKIKAVVCELDFGIRFIKEIKDVRVSFDLFLPQMLMENWKDPVPNDRPPPSVSNPNVEENAMDDDE